MDNINNIIRKTTDINIANVTSSHLKNTDVVQVWNEVSGYIEKYMTKTKGVTIPGFGTFTFVQKKSDIGNSKYILVQRPVFVIAEKFSQTHGLINPKHPVAGSIPVHPLNYAAIANETAFSRDDIELCVKHVLQVFNRSLQSKKNVEFSFNGIGKLIIRNSKVKMKFFKEFVNSVDQTGKAVTEMQNRPNTCDSVISRAEAPRPSSKNTCILPRINSRAGSVSLDNVNNVNNSVDLGTMDTIREENQEEDSKRISLAPVASIYSTEEQSAPLKSESSILPKVERQTSALVITNSKFQIPDVNNFRSQSFVAVSEPNFTQKESDTVNSILNDNTAASAISFNTAKKAELQLVRPSSRTLLGTLLPRPPQAICGHQNAGQELCYLCHQRQRRNNPVYLHEERRIKDQEETQLLMQYQQMKDLEQQLKDEEKRNSQRVDRARMDAFNMGVTEALKAKKKERPKTSDLGRSYVFRKRARTPPKAHKQHELSDYLAMQVERKNRERLQSRQERDYFEKMEQHHLAEELAAQREAFLKEKAKRRNDLKNTLDFQVKNKPAELPRVLPDGEVFGQYDAKNERLMQQKLKEIEASKFNLETVEQRKREDLLSSIKELEQDAENIERAKEELRIDRANRFNRMIHMRHNLEKDWSLSHQEKMLRDKDERDHRFAHDGLLVHEQCDKYRRCAQCQRDTINCGETNLWKESRYTAGTRLMV
ncbi:unnamed protein product [Brachionus calyciflorus]|uniref:CCDC81 HU domain-containing protein n=1 Tax=Brachionus calyciflorus TaxID=104777 RepID=A0A813Y0F4_9BILA|nr:unnamed protein product [Brachionus calyciflorus]